MIISQRIPAHNMRIVFAGPVWSAQIKMVHNQILMNVCVEQTYVFQRMMVPIVWHLPVHVQNDLELHVPSKMLHLPTQTLVSAVQMIV